MNQSSSLSHSATFEEDEFGFDLDHVCYGWYDVVISDLSREGITFDPDTDLCTEMYPAFRKHILAFIGEVLKVKKNEKVSIPVNAPQSQVRITSKKGIYCEPRIYYDRKRRAVQTCKQETVASQKET